MFNDLQFWDYFVLSLIVVGVVVFGRGYLVSKNKKLK